VRKALGPVAATPRHSRESGNPAPFARYPEYKHSGVAWLGKVPGHWKLKPIKAVASCNDETLEEATDPEKGIVYVEISGVSADRGITETQLLTFGTAPSRARRKVRGGDVLVSTVRTYLRAIAPIHDPPENLIASTGFAVVRPRTVNSAFLGYLFQSEFLIAQVIARSVGVSYPAINASELMRFTIPIPDQDEQAAIAAFLDRETSKIDALIAEQKKLIALLKEKRQALISHGVTKGLDPTVPMKDSGVEWLGRVPAHWELARLAAVFCEVSDVGHDGLPILSVSIHDGVSDRELSESELDRKITRSDDRSKYKAVEPGDLTYNMMRAWQGGFGAVLVAGQVSPAYVVARPTRTVCTAFIEQLLRTPQAIEQMRRYSRGVTDFRLRLYWEEFKNIHVALPSPQEQQAILDAVSVEAAAFDSLVKETERAIALLKERRSALISAAVTGKIDVRGLAQRAEAAQP
jgi:type I restriction enzyme S subunit